MFPIETKVLLRSESTEIQPMKKLVLAAGDANSFRSEHGVEGTSMRDRILVGTMN